MRSIQSIQVIATTYEGTRAAIETAALLARAAGVPFTVIVPRIVPCPADANAASPLADPAANAYRRLIDELGGSGQIRVCLCRGIREIIDRLTAPGMTVVVGGPSGRWRMSPEERFANELGRHGRRVVFASTGASPTSRRRAVDAALVWVVAIAAGSRGAAAQASPTVWQGGAFVDVAYLASGPRPANHLFRNRGTTPRVDEPALDMAGVFVRKAATDDSRVGFEATVHGGEDARAFGSSPTAPKLAGAAVLTHLGPTNVSYVAPVGTGLTLQGGIFSSLIGYDSLYAKDNFAYTRPWGADYTPYLMLGINAAYRVSDRLTMTAAVVNGYWHLAHANDVPSVAGQIAYTASRGVALKQAVLYGPHQAETSIARWRFLSDTIVERKMNRVVAAGEAQYGVENLEGGSRAWWLSLQAPVHWMFRGSWSLAVRPEWCRDAGGRWTGFDQAVGALTTSLEYRFSTGRTTSRVRGEYRYDHATGPGGGFFAGPVTASGAPALVSGQGLALTALIVAFDATSGGR